MGSEDNLITRALELHQGGGTVAAIEMLRHLVASDPTSVSARGNLACVLSDAEHYNEALSIFRKLYEEQGDEISCVNLIVVLRRMGCSEEAMRLGEGAARRWPNSSWILLELADLYEDAERVGEAAAHAERALAASPDDAHMLWRIGNRLGRLGRFGESARALERAVEIDERHQKAWSDLAASFVGLGEFGKARCAVARALELDPGDAISHCTLGNCQEHDQLLADALASYRRAEELSPDYGPARAEVARLAKRLARKRRHRRIWPFG